MLLAHLGLRQNLDIDFLFLSGRFRRLAQACGLGADAFSEARKVMASLRKIDPRGGVLLFRNKRKARYRICPRCFAGMRTPHFALQCRLEAWRYCPEHACMMEDSCWRCGAAVELPISPGIDGPRSAYCASLAQCVQCGARHRDAPVAELGDLGGRFDGLEQIILSNGAAFPAALFQQRVLMEDGSEHSLRRLRQLCKMGLLARKGYGPTATRWRVRAQQGAVEAV